ncbi:uncharacterized protein LOC114754113 [Neltuma alba]|uniref:uncharacterized protein LOC114754113 n=1 Tax=Neltuma alba TaxID=207710 RepID=UPI0010A35946|nr:uncharacterized protein LOC114754113 [Prosopis alba]
MGLIIKRFKKFYKSRARKKFQTKRRISTSQNESKEPIICFECKKPGHIKAECPQLSKMKDREKKKERFKKKAFVMSIWGDSSSEEEEESDDEETANICVVAQENEESEIDEVLAVGLVGLLLLALARVVVTEQLLLLPLLL